MAGKRCAHVFDDGRQCGGWACDDGDHPDLCFYHDPSLDDKRREAARRGARQTQLAEKERRLENLAAQDLPTEIDSLEDAQALLRQVMVLVTQGLLPREIGDTVTRMVREYRQGRKDILDERQVRERMRELRERLEATE